jgi:hypothetical protein
MCSVVRNNQCCGNSIVSNNLCKYHLKGGCMLSKNYYYSIKHEDWKNDGSPSVGDLKYENDIMYHYDSKQWRKQCLLCENVARPTYCSAHNPITVYNKSNTNSFSHLSCRFIDKLESHFKTSIIHKHIGLDNKTLEGCEYTIPSTKYRVDGIISNTNIIIEILGDFWHGNPLVYNQHDYNKTTQTTFGELLKFTFARFDTIVKKGFKILYVWENDIIQGKPILDILNKYGF